MTITKQTEIYKLPFNVRVMNCLKFEGIATVGDLLKYSELDILRFPNFGRASLNQVKSALAAGGFHLSGDFKALCKKLPSPEISVRDWFAGMAMQGILSHPEMVDNATEDNIAKLSYYQADAMLKERGA